MNRYQDMEDFLKYFAAIYGQNPNLSIDYGTIYSNLAMYGLNEKEINDREIVQNFQGWIDRFKNNPNLDVYYTERQPGFLQFQNRKSIGDKHVKLYLSYPKKKINNCVNKIFDYISKEDMVTCSKVSHSLRSDSVVLRMNNLSDAFKVINYINGDHELRKYAKETNPFSIKQGVVGIAYDNMLSYNSTLASVMEDYFKKCRNDNTLSYVSVTHFREFINQYINSVLKNKEDIKRFSKKNMVIKHENRFASIGEELLNYEQILELIHVSLNSHADINDYKNFYYKILDNKYSEQRINYYNDVINNKVVEQTEINEIELINSYLDLAINKYGSDKVYLYLERYVNGDVNAITRDNNFRSLFQQHIPPAKLTSIIGDINTYINKYINLKKQNDNYNMFLYGSIETYKKYDYNQLHTAVINAINGNYEYFTNGQYGYRNYLCNNVLPGDILKYCSIAIQMHNGNNNINNNSPASIVNEYCNIISGYKVNQEESQYNSSSSVK